MLFTLLVLDSVGAGALPDAADFGDTGSHTLGHLAELGLRLPGLSRLGLNRLPGLAALGEPGEPQASYGRIRLRSPGKDTTTGHWEFLGGRLETAFRTFPEGFPEELMGRFSERIGRGWLCNRPYSGSQVIADFGEAHLRSGDPIVYTSADSVFQIAAHEQVAPPELLYSWCEVARGLLVGEWSVARVIARPFRGPPFQRIAALRRDFSAQPPRLLLDRLAELGIPVYGIGKIPDIYAHRGFREEIHSDDNADGIEQTLRAMRTIPSGLIFTNLVDFDSLYGHRRDPTGYARALSDFDGRLGELLAAVPERGGLLLVSDHGNDPTWPGTDHTREWGICLLYRPGQAGRALGDREFVDVGATVAQVLGADWAVGSSFWEA